MKKVCLIGNAGGHLEQLRQIRTLENQYKIHVITNKCKATENNAFVNSYIEEPYKRTRIGTVIGYSINTIQAIYLLLRINPEVIISTGAGLAFPFCLFGKIFNKKIIYIESFARVTQPSRTGKHLYKFADVFIIQHEELREFYPDAVYGGWIY